MSKHRPTANDQRSVVKNPQTHEYQADRANRINLDHPNVPPPPPEPAARPNVPENPKKG